jgi:hypothetical protein
MQMPNFANIVEKNYKSSSAKFDLIDKTLKFVYQLILNAKCLIFKVKCLIAERTLKIKHLIFSLKTGLK